SVPTTFLVTTSAMLISDTDGKLSFWEALGAANSNAPFSDAPAGSVGLDTIRFAPSLSFETIAFPPALADGLPIIEDLTISRPGADSLTNSGEYFLRIFNVNPANTPGIDEEIRGLTLARGGALNGGAIRNRGNLTVTDCVFDSNSSDAGGAIYNEGKLAV